MCHHTKFHQAPFTLEIYFKILFQNKSFEIFLLKVSTLTLQKNFRKPYVNKIVNASFDVCKHWPTDQSQRSISEISSTKLHKIEHVLNCEIEFCSLFLSKVHTNNFPAKGNNIHKFRH